MRNQDLILMENEGILSQKGNQMNLIDVINENQMQEDYNADGEARIALEEDKQQEVEGKLEEETMLKGNQMDLIDVIDENQMQEHDNADGEARIALEEDKQQEIEGKLEEETMLTENIVKDRQLTMMIGTVEVAMEAVGTVKKEERHLLKDVKEEEVYEKDLAKGERTSDP